MSKPLSVNFVIEGSGRLGYLGCSTAAQYLVDSLKKDGIDIVVNGSGSYDIVHAHTFGPYALWKKRKGKTSVITAHSTPSLNKNNIAFGNSIWPSIYRHAYNSFDHVIAVSETSKHELQQIGIRKPIEIIPNGIIMERFRYNERTGAEFRKQWNIEGPMVLNVGQITPRKGVYDFIAVAKALPDIQFVWVGGIPYGPLSADYFKVRKLIKNAGGLSNLKFTGFVEDIVAAYSAADILLAPTYAESFGLNIVEALSCGLPVVARDLPVFRELFGDVLFYARDVEGFCARLEKIKPGQRSKNSVQCAARYDVRMVAERLKHYYFSIAQK
ncbi:MAG: glycosyltransferase family 4 protein [Candidatus Aenigmatarchaeota archaeon]